MKSRLPDPRTVGVDVAREQLDTLVAAAQRGGAPVVLARDGGPAAALVNMELFRRLRLQQERDFQLIDDIRAAFADVPEAELKREITKAVKEARAELHRARSLV